MVAITEAKGPALTNSSCPTPGQPIAEGIDQAVRRRIAACPYRFVFDKVTWHVDDGILRVRGCVPSFYLKQVLQELLRDIEQIDRVDNEVQVVSSTGLSGERPNVSR